MEQNDIVRIMTNPFYCIGQVHANFSRPHMTIISEEEFIAAGAKLIREIGAAQYIRLVLENLKDGGK